MDEMKDIQIKSREVCYQGYFTIAKYQLSYRLFNGQFSLVHSRELFEKDNAAAVLLYDPTKDQVVLLEQFRMGAIKAGAQALLYELVAGVMEPGESASEVAIRETKEETGVMVSEVVPICEYYSTPGVCTEKVYLFYSLVDSDQFFGVHGILEENENIKLHVMPRAQAYQMILDGQINHGTTLIGLQWLQLNYQNLCDSL